VLLARKREHLCLSAARAYDENRRAMKGL